jgi:heat shock protein HslJ
MKHIIILLGILGVLVACGTTSATQAPVPTVPVPAATQVPAPEATPVPVPVEPLTTVQPDVLVPYEDIVWHLTQLNGKQITQTPAPTIQFTNMMLISGQGFCNNYSGNYSGGMQSILIGNIASTEKACADTTLMDLEAEYFTSITNVLHLTASNDTLTLFDANETALAVFTKK